jgi:hypothetical protein
MRTNFFIAMLIVAGAITAFAQTTNLSVTPASQPATISQIDTYVKAAGVIVTGIATLFGLPIVFLTYRKTRVEITKLELEAKALKEKQGESPNQSKDEDGNIRILVDRSPHTSIQVLADPRFLAPLLILLDFIFAWIVLTLAEYLLSIFGFDALRHFALAVLAISLLLPIARQVMRVRSVLRPPRTPDEVRASLRQAKMTALIIYVTCVLSTVAFGVILLNVSPGNLTEFGRYLAWLLIGLGISLIALAPIARTRFNRLLKKMQESDTR